MPQEFSAEEKWNDKTRSDNDYEIACGIDSSDFDWKYDSFPEITRDRMKLYKLHVRGFFHGCFRGQKA